MTLQDTIMRLSEAKEVLEFYAAESKSDAKRLQALDEGTKARALLEKWKNEDSSKVP